MKKFTVSAMAHGTSILGCTLALVAFTLPMTAFAQANINESYVTQTLYVNPANANANDTNPGTAALPLRTIQAAVNKVGTAQATKIAISPGIYREAISVPAGNNILVMEGTVPGQVIITGADRFTNWTNLGSGLYSIPWTNNWGLGDDNSWSGATAYNKRREAIYIDDVRLLQKCNSDGSAVASSSLTAGQFTVDESQDKLFFKLPTGITLSAANDVEVITRGVNTLDIYAPHCGIPLLDIVDHNNVVLRNLTVMRDANFIKFNPAVYFHPSYGAADVSNILVDNCNITQNNGIGFEEDRTSQITLINSKFNDNGERGAGAGACNNYYVQDCQFNGNNWRMGAWASGNDAAGFKSFGTGVNSTLRFVRCQFNGNYALGMWNDYANDNTSLDHCIFENNYANSGMMREFSKGTLSFEACVFRNNTESNLQIYASPGVSLNNCYLYNALPDSYISGTYVSEIKLNTDMRQYAEGATGSATLDHCTITNSTIVATQPQANLFYEDSNGGSAVPKTLWLPTLTANYNRYYRRGSTSDFPGVNQFYSPTVYNSYLDSYTDINFTQWQAQSNQFGQQDLNSTYADVDLTNVADPTVITAAATPVFSPGAGTYTGTRTVTITDSTPGATIYYTTNGTTPTTSSTVYTSGITVASNMTIKALAVASGYSASPVASASYVINAPAQGVYNGPHNIPGTLQAEDYDTGGEGVAYHDTDTGNNGSGYRSDDVDIEGCTDTGGGYNVGWTAAGEYLKYTVNVATAGSYTVSFRVAATGAGNTFHLENASGTNLTGTLTCPNTGGWQTWQNVTATITLPAGTQVLKLVEDTGGYNFNSLTFTSAALTYTKLSGTVIGTTGSYNNAGNTIAKAFDANTTSFFDAPTADGNWAGLDLGSGVTKKITKIRFYPRASYGSRMTGGIFQGSNNQSSWTSLFTISGTPTDGAWTETTSMGSTTAFRYIRYLSPTGGWGNVAEVEFYTTP